jgi:copper chaperone CopZ
MATTTTRQYQIRGLHCSGCAGNLGRSLARLEGVVKADADYDQALVEVRFDPERVSDDDVHTQIRASGFEPVVTDVES